MTTSGIYAIIRSGFMVNQLMYFPSRKAAITTFRDFLATLPEYQSSDDYSLYYYGSVSDDFINVRFEPFAEKVDIDA